MLETKDYQLTDAPYVKRTTVYTDTSVPTKARILYFHGGGLLYGSRRDLPEGHIAALTGAGYDIIAYDYPLAPAAGLEMILEDVCHSINSACESDAAYTDSTLPYYLWGRSAGAYLCLIAAAGGRLLQPPKGILSYYGYGFLCDNWFCTPSSWYCSLPPVEESCLDHAAKTPDADGSLDTHYSIYVYARQTGSWKQLIYTGREKFFYLNYSLRTCDTLPCPLFCAHSTGDPDVPYAEFLELCNKYHAVRFIASGNEHDFDRDPEDPFTGQLLEATLSFLKEQ
ncbi:MAG: alpha/beta hydrolase [Lachnospiraceae bacterium]|nr:alpha/beta hydrolase [Lachnospiraceae bacterium]